MTLQVNSEVAIVNGEWVAVTEWYEPHQKPHRAGDYQISFFDCGWQYQTWSFWSGTTWLDKEGGNSLFNQNQTWRGLANE